MLLDLANQTKALALKAGLSEIAAGWVDESTDHAVRSLGIQVDHHAQTGHDDVMALRIEGQFGIAPKVVAAD